MEHMIGKLALIGVLGAGAQWLAWKIRFPAIVLLLLAGFLAGPVTGLLNPEADFGALLRPMVGLAVALILFEGGLSLNFAEIRETSKAVRRLVTLGVLISFSLGAAAGHYLAALSWPSALVLGAILVVTGPTVVLPLLRHARLTARAATLLRWEAILVDPVGALLAVLVLEIILVGRAQLTAEELVLMVGGSLVWAAAGGYGLGKIIVLAFVRGKVPEFMKAPLVVAAVMATYAISDLILEESGLLTVTILGVTLGNSGLASLTELRRFKEFISVLLVSGVFVILTATLEISAFNALLPRDGLFLLALLFIVRPAAVLLSTLFTPLPLRERLLAAWIAPRGVVAVAISGLFAVSLVEQGIADGDRLVALTFAVVIITVVGHGLTLGPLARLLGLSARGPQGILIVGGSPWSTTFAEKLKAMDLPVMIVDRNWSHLREPRYQGIDVFFGEILSELAEHHMDLHRFGFLVAATDNDDYNALVCTDFGPEFGRGNVFQVGRSRREEDLHSLSVTLGGRSLLDDIGGVNALNARLAEGWTFRKTSLTEDYDEEALRRDTGEEGRLVLVRRGNEVLWLTGEELPKLVTDDVVLTFGPATGTKTDN